MRSVNSSALICAIMAFVLCAPEMHANTDIVARVKQLVVTHHIDQPDLESLGFRSIAEINFGLRELDPYSRRFESSIANHQNDVSDRDPEFGIDLLPLNRQILILPRKGGPLYNAGIKDERQLVSVDRKFTEDLSLQAIGKLLNRAKLAGVVELGLQESKHSPMQFVRLKSSVITRLPVEVVAGELQAYIRVHDFESRRTSVMVARAIESLKATQQESVILDLRYAGGGDLFEALDTASLFLGNGELLATLVDGDGQRQAYYALPERRIVTVPTLILVGPLTASASEVFAAALRVHRAAVLVGRETYGKCLSQRVFALTDGSELLLSNRRILDPQGVYCDGRGLLPDVEVTESDLAKSSVLISKGLTKIFQIK